MTIISCAKQDIIELTPIENSIIRDTIVSNSFIVFDEQPTSQINCFYKSCSRSDSITENFLVFSRNLEIIDGIVEYQEIINVIKWNSSQTAQKNSYLAQGAELEGNSLALASKYLVTINNLEIDSNIISGSFTGDNSISGNISGRFECLILPCSTFEIGNELSKVYTEGVLTATQNTTTDLLLSSVSICSPDPSSLLMAHTLLYGGGKMNTIEDKLIIEETPRFAIYTPSLANNNLGDTLIGFYLNLDDDTLASINKRFFYFYII